MMANFSGHCHSPNSMGHVPVIIQSLSCVSAMIISIFSVFLRFLRYSVAIWLAVSLDSSGIQVAPCFG